VESGSTKKRGVTYARVNGCIDNQSLHYQIFLCQEKMRNDQVETVHPPIVDIASGKSLQRSGLEELQKLVKSRSIDYLYISDLSRLGREAIKTLQLLKSLSEADVTVKTVDGEFTFSGLDNIESA